MLRGLNYEFSVDMIFISMCSRMNHDIWTTRLQASLLVQQNDMNDLIN